jgi:hypothetical protein
MKTLDEYLEEFKGMADRWFAKADFLGTNYEFFQNFFKPENISSLEWPDIQKLGDHIHSFQSMAIAKKNALGRPNHPIEHYKKSFDYLAHGPGSIEERIKNFRENPEFQLAYFGDSAVSEIVGYLFADKFVLYNERDKTALELLGIRPPFERAADFATRLTHFTDSLQPLIQSYERIVGRRTKVPLNLEIDQFFNYLYETYGVEEGDPEPLSGGINYWMIAPGEGAFLWSEWQEKEIITIGWSNLGDLKKYKDKSEIRRRLQQNSSRQSSQKNNAAACYNFANVLKTGDIVFAKTGRRRVLGWGVVTSDYIFDDNRKDHKNIRKVKWNKTGDWILPADDQIAIKTLTCINQFPDFINRLKNLIGFDEALSPIPVPVIENTPSSFSSADVLSELFMTTEDFESLLVLLREKKNLILQGPPGVGKTFVARVLAYAVLKVKDDNRVCMVQFHQSYSYEDFIQGYRPTEDGRFDLKNGVFFEFCKRAQVDPENDYILVIDEINRGNLSKIFGELMMLIEPDKRGRKFALPLAYSRMQDDKFFVPERLYLIGTMNTADRSLAMVDYALRRRFRFVTLHPQFDNPKFQNMLQGQGAGNELVQKIVTRMNALNDLIANDKTNLGVGYRIGHSFFCPTATGLQLDESWYKRVIKSDIEPLLYEYWFDDEDKAKKAVEDLLR